MAKENHNSLLDVPPIFGGKTTALDDVAYLTNIISQMGDFMSKEDYDSVTAYDEKNNMDWGIDDVIAYMRRKYGENI